MAFKSWFKELGFKKLKSISFGMFASLFLLWTLFNSSSFVPEGLELTYTLSFLGYGILGVYIIGRQDLRSKLKNISLLRALPYFAFAIIASFFVFSLLLGLVDPLPQTLMAVLTGIPLYLQVSNALVYGVVETSTWQGVLDPKIGILGSMIVAGFFHMFIWQGGLFQNFLGSALLFGFFSFSNVYMRNKLLKWNFKPQLAVALALVITIGIHVGYNLAKYRIIFGV